MPGVIPVLVGLFASGAAGGGGSSTPKPPVPDPTAQAEQVRQEKAAIAGQAPTIQSQLGGAVSPDYYIQAADTAAGFAGDTNIGRQALSGFLGLGEGGSGATLPGTSATSPTPPTPPTSTSGQPEFFSQLLERFYPGASSQDIGLSGGYA